MIAESRLYAQLQAIFVNLQMQTPYLAKQMEKANSTRKTIKTFK